jgi:hypothetical protein
MFQPRRLPLRNKEIYGSRWFAVFIGNARTSQTSGGEEIVPVGKETDRTWDDATDMRIFDFEVKQFRKNAPCSSGFFLAESRWCVLETPINSKLWPESKSRVRHSRWKSFSSRHPRSLPDRGRGFGEVSERRIVTVLERTCPADFSGAYDRSNLAILNANLAR